LFTFLLEGGDREAVSKREKFVYIFAFDFQLVAVDVAEEHHHEVVGYVIVGGLPLLFLCEVMRELSFEIN